MDETSLHALLDSAIGDEPPIGPVARNSLREGMKLRRRGRLWRAAGAAAVVTAAAACIPAFTGVAGNRATAPSAATAYVANYSSGTVTPIDLATNTPGTPVRVGKNPVSIAITPDGKTAYVGSGGGEVTPIDLATNTPGKPIPVGEPVSIAITPDGKTAYVADGYLNTVTPIDLATNTPGKPIGVSEEGGVFAILMDGKTADVVGYSSGTVTPIDPTTNMPGRPVKAWHSRRGDDVTWAERIAIVP